MMNIKISKKVSVKQHDQNDCGAACMASVLAYYGRLMHFYAESSRRKTKQFSSYFRFPTSHTTVRAVPHTAVPILDTIRDMPPLK